MMRLLSHILLPFGLCLFLFSACSDEPAVKNYTRSGNSMLIRVAAEPGSLNPILAAGRGNTAQVLRHVLQYLMVLDPQTQEWAPQLVKGLPQIDPIEAGPYAGGLAYTFEMLEEATWDNGTPVLPEDFIFTLKAVKNPKVPAQRVALYFDFIKDITIDPDNPRKFTVFTNEKYILSQEAIVAGLPVMPRYVFDPENLMGNFTLAQLSDPAGLAAIENDPALQAFADLFTSEQYSRGTDGIIGSGPYTFVEWESGQRIVLRKKENWWGTPLAEKYPSLLAYPDTIIYKPIVDPASAATQARDEQLDIVHMPESRDFTEMRADPRMNELYNFYTAPMFGFYLIYLNTKDEKLEDRRVRRAMAHLIDLDEMIETIFYGLGDRINGPIHPTKDYYDRNLPNIELDLEQATRLLNDAGWTDTDGDGVLDKVVNGQKVDMRLEYHISNNEVTEKIALLFKDYAAKVGVEVEIIKKEFREFLGELNARNFDLAGSALSAQPILDDPYQLFHTDSDRPDGTNRTGFGNAESDAVIEAIRQTLDKPKRDSLYQVFQEMVYEEQPMIFLMAAQARLMVHKRFDAFTSPVSPNYFPERYRLLE